MTRILILGDGDGDSAGLGSEALFMNSYRAVVVVTVGANCIVAVGDEEDVGKNKDDR